MISFRVWFFDIFCVFSFDGIFFFMYDEYLSRIIDVVFVFLIRIIIYSSDFFWVELKRFNVGVWFLEVRRLVFGKR